MTQPLAKSLRRWFGETHGEQQTEETSMSDILIDAVKAVTFHNGLLRFGCIANGHAGKAWRRSA